MRLDNGLYVQLADVGNDMVAGFGCCRAYRYAATLPTGHYVVTLERGEARGALVISPVTGAAVEMVDVPRPDPADPATVVPVASSDMLGYRAEIWRLTDGAWARTYACDHLPYGAAFTRWEAGRVVLTVPADRDPEREFSFSAAGPSCKGG